MTNARDWSQAQVVELRRMIATGAPVARIARDLGRSQSAVRTKMHRLRQPGEAMSPLPSPSLAILIDAARSAIARSAQVRAQSQQLCSTAAATRNNCSHTHRQTREISAVMVEDAAPNQPGT